jgi:hypothetical protein
MHRCPGVFFVFEDEIIGIERLMWHREYRAFQREKFREVVWRLPRKELMALLRIPFRVEGLVVMFLDVVIKS